MGKETVDALITSLKDNFKKELDTFWESYDNSTPPTAPKEAK